MNTSEVLNRAADRIQEFGHQKGQAVGGGDIRTTPMCVVGAITYVKITSALTQQAGWRAQDAMDAYLGRGLVCWNDEPDRTAAEVVEVLRACAVIEAAKETARLPGGDLTPARPVPATAGSER